MPPADRSASSSGQRRRSSPTERNCPLKGFPSGRKDRVPLTYGRQRRLLSGGPPERNHCFQAEQTVVLVQENPNPLFRKADAEAAAFWSAESASCSVGSMTEDTASRTQRASSSPPILVSGRDFQTGFSSYRWIQEPASFPSAESPAVMRQTSVRAGRTGSRSL